MTSPEPTPQPTPPQITYPAGPPGGDGGMGGAPLWPPVLPGPDGTIQVPQYPPYIPEEQFDINGPMPRSTLDGIHGTSDDDPVRWSPSHPGELPPFWMHEYVQDKNDPDLWWPDTRPPAPGSTHPASFDAAKDGKKADEAGPGSKLDVTPSDLTNVADQYADLQRQAAAIGPQAVEAVNEIIATHGAMGYPVAVGVVAGLARKQAQVESISAQFGVYSIRFAEHTAAYQGQDSVGAAGYQQVQFSV